jgi:hypothetical protein
MKREAGAGGRDAGQVVLGLVTGACFLFSLVLVANNIYPTRQKLDRMRFEKARLEEEIRARETQIDLLNRRGDALTSDPYTLDRTLREVLKMNREGELLIRFGEE